MAFSRHLRRGAAGLRARPARARHHRRRVRRRLASVVPQLNVFAVGFPAKVAVGLLLIGVSLPFVAGWLADELQRSVARLRRLHSAEPVGSTRWPPSDKTEKATPKKRDDARKKGQVARSPTSTARSSCSPPHRALRVRAEDAAAAATRPRELLLARRPARRRLPRGLGDLLLDGRVCVAADARRRSPSSARSPAVVVVAQVGFKPSAQALKPDPKRSTRSRAPSRSSASTRCSRPASRSSRSSWSAPSPRSPSCPSSTSSPRSSACRPPCCCPMLATMVLGIAQRAALAYLVIASLDFGYQKWRHEKDLKMDKQEVKDEAKQQGLPAEVKGAQRRRAMKVARARMMDAVPTADVVVTNPTHYAVALRYRADEPRPRSSPRGRTTSRCASASARARPASRRPRPAARALAARVGRGRPDDPRGALPGRRPAARLRLPRRRTRRRAA